MTDDNQPILVFGATGRQGGSVARTLLKAGRPVRAVVRDHGAPASSALRFAGAELVQASFPDREAIRRAMRGIHGVFVALPANLLGEEEVRLGTEIANLAVETGISHLVYSSGVSVGEKLTGIARFDAKPRIEAHIRELSIAATIVRPMIFMEMMVRPGFGLEHGRLMSLVRHDQTMQLIAVEDIGRFVAAFLADPGRFAGQTVTIAGDTVTGDEMAGIFSEAASRSIAYSRFGDEVFATNADLSEMASSLEDGPLSRHADLEVLRRMNPQLLSLRDWIARDGGRLMDAAMAADGSKRSD